MYNATTKVLRNNQRKVQKYDRKLPFNCRVHLNLYNYHKPITFDYQLYIHFCEIIFGEVTII